MPTIRISLEAEEYSPISRLAATLHVQPEDIAYAGLNLVMLSAQNPDTKEQIALIRQWRAQNLPRWSDSARSVHAYEGKADEHSEPSGW